MTPRDTARTRRDSARTPQDTARTRRDTSTAGAPRSRPEAVFPVPPRADSVVVDSTKARDTSPAVPMPADTAGDTLRAPLARSETPPAVAIGEAFRWDRPAIYNSGALTLLDLLERIPGVTGFRAGWIGAPMHAAYLGQVDRVRVYYDGLELDPLDGRTGRILDLAQVQLWTLEEVAVERDADELRVFLRSWSVNSTNAYTRTDVYTGDEDTNIYRGWFGRRYRSGWALQTGGQQYSTTNDRVGGSSDLLGLFLRVGWAKGSWRADGTVNRTGRTRQITQRRTRRAPQSEYPPLAPLEGRNTEAYLRAGFRQPGDHVWAQLLAGSLIFSETSTRTDSNDTSIGEFERAPDLADTAVSRAQYVAAAGVAAGGLSASVTGRVRVYNGRQFASPSARVAFDRSRLSVSLFGEQDVTGATRRLSATARLTPLPFLAVLGSVARRSALDPIPLDSLRGRVALGIGGFVAGSALRRAQPTATSALGEVGLRLRRLWVSGGVMARDTALLATPVVFDKAFRYDTLTNAPVSQGRLTGAFASVRGTVWRDVFADAWGARWSGADSLLQPSWQSRATLGLRTEWLRRFPSGNFGFQLAATHEYRSRVAFPSSRGTLHAGGSRTLGTLLELRLLSAVITWQYRNVTGQIYEQVPGYEMPRPTNVYGVRWEFRN